MISEIAVSYSAAVDRALDSRDPMDMLGVHAMVDSFYVNVMLMADFLVRGTSKIPGREDFGPADLGVDWSLIGQAPDGATDAPAQRLHERWDDASRYVVHFSMKRVPDQVDGLEPFQIGSPYFRNIATDVLYVFARFLRRLIDSTPEWTADAYIPGLEPEPEKFMARVLHDRTDEVEEAFRTACDRLGLDSEALLKADR